MSLELNYRNYVKKYFLAGWDVTKPIDVGEVAHRLGLSPNKLGPSGQLAIPEFDFRRSISTAVGAVEEDAHDVTKNEQNTRVKIVPEYTVPFHTRLCEELYQLLTPIDQAGAKE